MFVGSEIGWAQGFGWADRDRRIAADVNTIYRIGSISKSFTALLMTQLAARDALDIDKLLSDYLPEAKQLAGGADTLAAVTLRRLASHTAGLIREPELPGAADGPIAMWEDKIIASTSTDGFLAAPGEGFHPRGNGTYARKIRRYVVERGTISLSQAIHSMTGLPASVLRLQDHGTLRPGAVADIVVFDLEHVTDRATYVEPYQLSEGMVFVMVNGELAIDGGEFTGAVAGRVLRRR